MTIKELREEKGLSQKAFAEAIGMKTPTIGAYEQGRIKPSEAVLAKIKEIYGVDVTTPAEQASPAEGAKPTKRTSQKKKEEAGSAPVPVEEAKPRKRGGRKKAAPVIEEAVEQPVAVEEKKTTKRGKKAGVTVVIQSPMGGSITPEEIIKKTGPVDAVYVRVDENKAYWVRGDETGSVDLW
jgi:transcriptional regulator with XRE-family HTH domain